MIGAWFKTKIVVHFLTLNFLKKAKKIYEISKVFLSNPRGIFKKKNSVDLYLARRGR